MTTVRELIHGSLRLIGEVGEGQAASAEAVNDAFNALNEIIDFWTADGNFIYNDTREVFTLTAGQKNYTWGIGGNFNSPRPYSVKDAFIVSGGISYPVVAYDMSEYANAQNKDMGGQPFAMYWDNNYPLANVILHYVPNQNYELHIYSLKPLTNFNSIDDVINLPQGWERALRYNLAVAIAPEYDKTASNDVKQIAASSMVAISRAWRQKQRNILRVDTALQRYGQDVFNVYTGWR